jgi:rod shape determining protein RodA
VRYPRGAMDRDFGLSEEQREIVGLVRGFVAERIRPAIEGYEEKEEFPREEFRALCEMGLGGIPYDERYGGAGQGYLTYLAVLEELATGSLPLAVGLSVHHLAASGVHTFGSDALKERYLPKLFSGEWLGAYAPSRHVDPMLILAALGLTALGLLVIYSATSHSLEAAGVDPRHFVNRQMVSLGVGLGAMVAVATFDYRVYRAWAPVVYGAAILMLVLTLVTGETVNASRAWIVFGGFQFQPAELAKPALILVLAALFHERRESGLGLRALVEAVSLAAVPMLLILLQPDLGTAMVFVAITFGVLLLARVRVRYMVILALVGILSIVGALQTDQLEEYQKARLTSFLDPGADTLGHGYNVNQAQIAIGAGRFTGRGLFQGSQTTLFYVPENHTDFIFTVVGEELGFLGAGLMLGVYLLLLWRALRIATLSRDTLGTLLAGGVVSVFAFQMFINIGMSIGIMPVTGLPLPFVSYGGSSLIAAFIMIGLLQSVHMRRFS